MRTFEHFPGRAICPLCGTDNDAECVLIRKAGTEQDGICEAAPVHTECLEDKLVYFEEQGAIAALGKGRDGRENL